MGNGTKVALVALLVLMVVVIARFVRNESGSEEAPPTTAGAELAKLPNGTTPATSPGNTPRRTANPAQDPSSRTRTGPGATAQAPQTTRSANLANNLSPRGTTPAAPAPAGPRNAASGTATPSGQNQGVGPRLPAQNPVVDTTNPPEETSPSPGGGTQPGAPDSNSSGTLVATGDKIPAPISVDKDPAGSDLRAGALAHSAAREGEAGVGRSYAPLRLPPKVGQEGLPVETTNPKKDTGPGSEARREPGPGSVAEPTPVPPPPATPPDGFPKTHAVEKGDSFWRLAERYYGKGYLWQEIEKANPGVNLIPGKKLSIPAPPAVAVAQSTKSQDPPKAASETRTHLVQKNETLWGLAEKFYGDGRKLELIREANSDLRSGGVLIAGKTIVIPAIR